jgi:hypothetical protein
VPSGAHQLPPRSAQTSGQRSAGSSLLSAQSGIWSQNHSPGMQSPSTSQAN